VESAAKFYNWFSMAGIECFDFECFASKHSPQCELEEEEGGGNQRQLGSEIFKRHTAISLSIALVGIHIHWHSGI
jgi:hypothetical protein